MMALLDRRDEMSLLELVEELSLAYPERVASFEGRHTEAMEIVVEEDLTAPEDASDPEMVEPLEDLQEELQALLRV